MPVFQGGVVPLSFQNGENLFRRGHGAMKTTSAPQADCESIAPLSGVKRQYIEQKIQETLLEIATDIALKNIIPDGLALTAYLLKLGLEMGVGQKAQIEDEIRLSGNAVLVPEGEHVDPQPQAGVLHKEYGIRLKMDLSKMFFTPRLSTERWRITKSMNNVNSVIDMFAGVGPFSIMIAKHRDSFNGPKRVEAIELNPNAYRYLEKNIRLNKVEDTVIPYEGDAKKRIKDLKKVDRIIMNLPERSDEFLRDAILKTKKNGIINFYTFSRDIKKTKSDLKNIVETMQTQIKIEFLNFRKIRSYSKESDNFVIDIRVI